LSNGTPGAWARVRRAAAGLTPEAIEQIAQRVAQLLGHDQSRGPVDLLDASTLARRLGVSRDWVYEHANELGAITLGDGSRPRLRFDAEVAEEALRARTRGIPTAQPRTPGALRRRRREPRSAPLLPVHEPGRRGVFARWRGPGRR